VDGHPLTPLDRSVDKLRERMLKIKEFDIRTSLLGDLVLIDEYRDKMVENLQAGRYPAFCDSQELKRIVDAKATIVRLPSEVSKKEDNIYDQIRDRMARARECGVEVITTNFQEIGDQATNGVMEDEPDEESTTSCGSGGS